MGEPLSYAEDNRAAIAEAVEALVDDFTEGKLLPAGDA